MARNLMSQTPQVARHGWTYSEYARLPDDGNRYEVLDGEVLVTPAPSPHHQMVVQRLLVGLIRYVEERGHGWVFQDVDLLFASGHFLRPDLVVVPASSREGITDRGVELPPALVVEVVSPSSRSVDRMKKPRRYMDFGVPAYWVVDPSEGVVWIWERGKDPEAPVREEDTLRWIFPEGSEESFEVRVTELVGPL
jgi:Uma2 family endonuclease